MDSLFKTFIKDLIWTLYEDHVETAMFYILFHLLSLTKLYQQIVELNVLKTCFRVTLLVLTVDDASPLPPTDQKWSQNIPQTSDAICINGVIWWQILNSVAIGGAQSGGIKMTGQTSVWSELPKITETPFDKNTFVVYCPRLICWNEEVGFMIYNVANHLGEGIETIWHHWWGACHVVHLYIQTHECVKMTWSHPLQIIRPSSPYLAFHLEVW